MRFGKLAVACFLSPIWGGILTAIFVGSNSPAYDFCINVLSVCFVAGFVFLILWAATKKPPSAEDLKPLNAAKRAMGDRISRTIEDYRPVEAVLISTNSKTKTGSALGRAALGSWLFGFAGAVIGAATASSKDTATFSVKYASGRTGVETVDVKSARFRELAALLYD